MQLLATNIFDIDTLLAQAGGGGSFGGGGGGGGGFGGGGSGGGGDGALFFWFMHFTLQYPQFGIPLIVAGLFILYQLQQAESGHRITRTIRRGRRIQEDRFRLDALATICRRDPVFTEELFLQRV